MRMLEEIREQPEALRRLAASAARAHEIAEQVRGRRLVRLVAHGSSDNAAAYGVYALGVLAGMTAMRDSISLSVYYEADLDFSDSAVIALSQSGRTQDVVAYLERARARGALTVALTNDAASPLAQAADEVLELQAGEETAVAATKTYSNQIGAVALLAGVEETQLRATADVVEQAVAELEPVVPPVAAPFAFVGRMLIVGRGFEFATAREIALKLTETCRIAAEPLTATAMQHGPVAALDALFPLWVIASDDASLHAVVAAAKRAREIGGTVLASGPAHERVDGAAFRLPSPPAPSPELEPLVSVVAGQLFAWSLARAKGLDPDRPAHLTKITVSP
jgi:glucosamine--fructose-6-phosphate aminotransferase (isomerizing)